MTTVLGCRFWSGASGSETNGGNHSSKTYYSGHIKENHNVIYSKQYSIIRPRTKWFLWSEQNRKTELLETTFSIQCSILFGLAVEVMCKNIYFFSINKYFK